LQFGIGLTIKPRIINGDSRLGGEGVQRSQIIFGENTRFDAIIHINHTRNLTPRP
jgi:hypothetical protein